MSDVKSMMSLANGQLPFCAGCGHDSLLHSLDKALVGLALPAEQVVLVTDIGCIGLADHYFKTHVFHGLHGRSLTYATGIQLARPELKVIVLMGDGACGIGGAHLLNTARRNVNITVIVANNFNYGMTGGQQSVTTPMGGITATSKQGNAERGLDVCAVVKAAGASWVYRGTTFDQDLVERMSEAIGHRGFALLDVWEICTAYYSPRNQFKKADLRRVLDQQGFEQGLLVKEDRPDLSQHLVDKRADQGPESAMSAPQTLLNKETQVSFEHNLSTAQRLIIAGSAGQKIRSHVTLFAKAAMCCGLYATQKDDYPITITTGHSMAELILSPQRIHYTGIDTPDVVLLLSMEGVAKLSSAIVKWPASTVIYAEAGLTLPKTQARVIVKDWQSTAKRIHRYALTPLALATVIKEQGMFNPEALEHIVTTTQRPEQQESWLAVLSRRV